MFNATFNNISESESIYCRLTFSYITKQILCCYAIHFFLCKIKDLYSRKDTNLVFTRFISHGEVLCYNRAKINSFILKCLEKSHRKINQLHQTSCYTSSINYTTQNNPWICRYRFNGKKIWIFFCITPHTRKITKKYSRVSYI